MKTDLDSLKMLAYSFLYQEIEVLPNLDPRLAIIHPIFESSIVPVKTKNGLEAVDLLEDAPDRVEMAYKKVEDSINGADSARFISILVRKSYRLTFLKYAKGFLSKKDFSELLRDVWTTSDDPNGDVNVSIREAVKMFKYADKWYLMSDEERKYIDSLPEIVEVYRGVSVGRNPDGLSYTNDRAVSEWFSHRFDSGNEEGYIISGKVRKSDILAYFATGESEIVVDRRTLFDTKIV